MRNLLNFLLKYNYWFLFILLEVASFVLLFRFNRYQQSAFFTSANTVVGAVYEVSGGISSYFHLKSVNEDLLDRNMVLEQQITNLEKALRGQQLDSMAINSIRQVPQADYQLFKAHVIKNSLNLVDNYITLDKGSSSGIRSEMGVVDGNGIVGIVYETSPSYSVVISVLNSKSNISCKIIGSDYFGYLKWEHGDSRYAYLKDLPRHAEFNLGDTVVTSGFSTVFPEGIMVGTVDDMSDSNDGLSYLLKIKLATVSCTLPVGYDIGSVGVVLPGIEVKIGEDNEILLRGKTITKGYYKKAEATAAAIEPDGWFHTGDAGYFKNGQLFLTERIKDLFKTSNGKYVAPQALETKLVIDRYIDQIAIIADQRKFVSALIVPVYGFVKEYAKEKGIEYKDMTELLQHPKIVGLFRARIDTLQQQFAHYEQIKRFTLLPEPFSMERGELTNTLKLKRAVVAKNYSEQIEKMYEESEK